MKNVPTPTVRQLDTSLREETLTKVTQCQDSSPNSSYSRLLPARLTKPVNGIWLKSWESSLSLTAHEAETAALRKQAEPRRRLRIGLMKLRIGLMNWSINRTMSERMAMMHPESDTPVCGLYGGQSLGPLLGGLCGKKQSPFKPIDGSLTVTCSIDLLVSCYSDVQSGPESALTRQEPKMAQNDSKIICGWFGNSGTSKATVSYCEQRWRIFPCLIEKSVASISGIVQE